MQGDGMQWLEARVKQVAAMPAALQTLALLVIMLELLLMLAGYVATLHRHGILGCDIKFANMGIVKLFRLLLDGTLIEEYVFKFFDEEALIFLDEDDGANRLVSGFKVPFGRGICTPQLAAPEQLEKDPARPPFVCAGSDVYALGANGDKVLTWLMRLNLWSPATLTPGAQMALQQLQGLLQQCRSPAAADRPCAAKLVIALTRLTGTCVAEMGACMAAHGIPGYTVQ